MPARRWPGGRWRAPRWSRPDGSGPAAPPATARSSRLVLTRAALSIDNLIVGFALGAYKVPIALAAIAIEVVSVGMSLLGLEVGDRLGTPVEMRSSEVGGIVLILVGAAIAAGIF